MKGRSRLGQSLFIIYQIPKREKKLINQSKRAQSPRWRTKAPLCLLACYAEFLYTCTLPISHPPHLCARTACVDVDVSRRSNTLSFSFTFSLLLFSLHSPPVRPFLPLSLSIIYAIHPPTSGGGEFLFHGPPSSPVFFFYLVFVVLQSSTRFYETPLSFSFISKTKTD